MFSFVHSYLTKNFSLLGVVLSYVMTLTIIFFATAFVFWQTIPWLCWTTRYLEHHLLLKTLPSSFHRFLAADISFSLKSSHKLKKYTKEITKIKSDAVSK